MKITEERLGEIARRFLDTLNRNGISSAGDIKKNLGRRFDVKGEVDGRVEIESRVSLGPVHSVSYKIKDIGIPIEIAINQELGYSLISIKTGKSLDGYEVFSIEKRTGNKRQSRMIYTRNLSELTEEIRKISLY